jgi:hypothetical protein
MRARARISLAATSDGGLSEPMPLPCHSLLLGVDEDRPQTEGLFLGVQIAAPSHEALEPGADNVFVDLRLISDRAGEYLRPGATFTLLYPLQVIGQGEVLEVVSP